MVIEDNGVCKTVDEDEAVFLMRSSIIIPCTCVPMCGRPGIVFHPTPHHDMYSVDIVLEMSWTEEAQDIE